MTPERWKKIEQLCNSAWERETSQRAAFLAHACEGDDDLRREVESLLLQDQGAKRFLEAPVMEVAAKMFSKEQSQSLIGRQMGSYQVLSLLGVGGMGEVYEAHDMKLGRNVAVKVLPAAFVHDPERLSRFQREARMLASLNHPNIATIHGLEQSEGVHFLVMELVPGPTLAERIGKGACPLREALKVAGQIAEALEAAHEKGVIHRDLKPANVKLTPEGRVKVLDFGLAKAFAGDGPEDLSQISTLSKEGSILGTPAYMSPEQARGKPLDKRTDIWAFGCVLYELLTGQRAFPGDTVQDTIVSVLEREPDQQALPAATPMKVRELLRRCLQKDPLHRLRDIGDARIELQEAIAASFSSPESVASQKSARPQKMDWRWIASLAGFGAILMALAIWYLKPSATSSGVVSRLAIQVPAGQQVAGIEAGEAIAISPDGTRLAYIARQGGIQQLYIRPLEALEARAVPGSEGAVEPFFSPDGQWLGFFAGRSLKKVSVNGGETLTLAEAGDPRGAAWGSRGVIVLAPTRATILQRVADTGGALQPLTHIEKQEGSHRWPEFLPGGRAVLFAAGNSGQNWDNARIAVQSMDIPERRDLIENATQPHYTSSGHLVYARSGNLMAVPFNVRRLEVKGPPVPVVEDVLQLPLTGAAQYSVSTNGSLIYVPATAQSPKRSLVWVTRKGGEEPLNAPPRAYRQPRLSPDGRRIAVAIEEQETEIWLYDLVPETLTRFTLEGSLNNNPLWTPDGKRVLFQSEPSVAEHHLFWQNADGSAAMERATSTSWLANSFSPDGQLLAIGAPHKETGWDITIVRISDDAMQPFLVTPFNEAAPIFSPDGHWLAYTSDLSGRYEIYAQPYPGPGGKWRISTEGGTEPTWNRNGRELFYRSGDRMMAVDITTQPGFSVGKPRVLFQGRYQASPTLNADYDVSPDGQRFLMLKPGDTQQAAVATQINVVLNWFEELKQKVPTGKN